MTGDRCGGREKPRLTPKCKLKTQVVRSEQVRELVGVFVQVLGVVWSRCGAGLRAGWRWCAGSGREGEGVSWCRGGGCGGGGWCEAGGMRARYLHSGEGEDQVRASEGNALGYTTHKDDAPT